MQIQQKEILLMDRIKQLDLNQREEVMAFIDRLPKKRHSENRYRKKALKEIRAAIKSQ
jgi:hypothetical protein